MKRQLCDRARDYEQTSFRGLFRFLRYIEELKKRETDLSTARTLGESEDVVRIMTIHKSKGLEFPVVIVADLGKGFNVKDAEGDLLMHRELGIGLYRVEKERSLRYSTLSHEAVSACLRKESKAEELRVLYVAMTRAKEKQFVAESLKKGELNFSAEDPDAPENFPRNLFIWRANLITSSSKGHEYFLKYLLGTKNGLFAEEKWR